MKEMYIVYKVALDYDDYERGNTYDKVGPFDTASEAQAFIDEMHPMIPGLYTRTGIKRGHAIKFKNVLSWVMTPERYKEKF